jgi:hypothetical protein
VTASVVCLRSLRARASTRFLTFAAETAVRALEFHAAMLGRMWWARKRQFPEVDVSDR